MSIKRSRAAAFDADSQHAPYALYGTPLPTLDLSVRDDGSYVPVWKQEVTDEHGRKRLHGAFTGGWSAGYFNTVGSKEGWAPKTFVSSRANRVTDHQDGKQVSQRVEDFMDDEDLADHADTQQLETRQSFSGIGSVTGQIRPRNAVARIYRPTTETKGKKLLQRMGWREGQGIGPKIRRRAFGDDEGEFHLFAPGDHGTRLHVQISGRSGLGFVEGRPLLRAPRFPRQFDEADEDSGEDAKVLRLDRSKSTAKSRSWKKPGLGPAPPDEEDSDIDENEYAIGPRIRRVRAAQNKRVAGIFASSTELLTSKPSRTSKAEDHGANSIASMRKCHDGKVPLHGFNLPNVSTNAIDILTERNYAPPQVPDGWTSQKHESTAKDVAAMSESRAANITPWVLDAKSRADHLGEKQLPGKSIFDFISSSDRDRIAAQTGKPDLPPGLGERIHSRPDGCHRQQVLQGPVRRLDQKTAIIALQRAASGWMPYSEDPKKQNRYRAFLEFSATVQPHLAERPRIFSRDEWLNELSEFAEAAKIFKPVSGLMATRFTSSTNAPTIEPSGLEVSSDHSAKDGNPVEQAAKMGSYGPTTRWRQPFYPTRLLCKRFNVKLPTNASMETNRSSIADIGSTSEQHPLDPVRPNRIEMPMLHSSLNPSQFASADSEEIQMLSKLAKVEGQGNKALEADKAGAAVFRAIFGSDEEET